jgi:hypothetical protein
MPLINKPWTESDIDRLKTLLANGSSAVRAAAALKRTVNSVKVQARKLGMPFPSVVAVRKLPESTPSLWPHGRPKNAGRAETAGGTMPRHRARRRPQEPERSRLTSIPA